MIELKSSKKCKCDVTKYKYYFFVNFIQIGIEWCMMTSIGQTISFLLSTASDNIQTFFPYDSETLHYPIIGALIQIFIGALSDQSKHQKGKRRWVVLLGFVIYMIFQLVVVVLMVLGIGMHGKHFTVDDEINASEEFTKQKFYGVRYCLIIVSFLCSIGLNIMQIGYRGFLLDEFDVQYQTKAYVMSSFASGIARFLFSGITLIIVGLFAAVKKPEDVIEDMYSAYYLVIQIFSLFVMSISMFVFYVCAKEIPSEENGTILSIENFLDSTDLLSTLSQSTNQNTPANQINQSIQNNAESTTNTLEKETQKKKKQCLPSGKEYFKDLWNGTKELFLHVTDHKLISIYVIVLIGWYSYYTTKDRTDNIYYKALFETYNGYKEIILHQSINLLISVIMIIFSIVMILTNKWIDTTVSFSYGITALSMVVYFIQIVDNSYVSNDSHDVNDSNEQLPWLQIIFYLLPMICTSTIYCHLNCLPYATLRSIVPEQRFGLALGFLHFFISCGEFGGQIVSIGDSIIYSDVKEYDNNNLNEIDKFSNQRYIYRRNVSHILYSFCMCLFMVLVTRLFILRRQTNQQNNEYTQIIPINEGNDEKLINNDDEEYEYQYIYQYEE